MIQYNWCYKCKGMVKTKEELRLEPHKRFVWLCIHCGTILAIKGDASDLEEVRPEQ